MAENLHGRWCDEFSAGHLSRPRAVQGRDQARRPPRFDATEGPGCRNIVFTWVLGCVVGALLVGLAGHAPDVRSSRSTSPVPFHGGLGEPNSSARGLLLCALNSLADEQDVGATSPPFLLGVSETSESTRVGTRGATGEKPGPANLSRQPLWAVILSALETSAASPPLHPSLATTTSSSTPVQLTPTPMALARSLSFAEVKAGESDEAEQRGRSMGGDAGREDTRLQEVLRPLAMLARATAPQPAAPPESWNKIASMIGALEASLKHSLPEEPPGAPLTLPHATYEGGSVKWYT